MLKIKKKGGWFAVSKTEYSKYCTQLYKKLLEEVAFSSLYIKTKNKKQPNPQVLDTVIMTKGNFMWIFLDYNMCIEWFFFQFLCYLEFSKSDKLYWI